MPDSRSTHTQLRRTPTLTVASPWAYRRWTGGLNETCNGDGCSRRRRPTSAAPSASTRRTPTSASTACGSVTDVAAPDASLEKRRIFRLLHGAGCFVLPNPWDVGTTRYLQHLGFPALATTSAGAAFAMGRPDSDEAVSCDAMLAHIRTIAEASDLPVNADFGAGYA